MTTATSSTTSSSALAALTGTSSATSNQATTLKSAQDTSDRFLKLLVAQMQNQDPLNPMDNAQVTTQMAQINTVSGISQLNTTMTGLVSQFSQLQAMQGASLVGKSVLVEGNGLNTASDGSMGGAFDLAGAADAVKVDILSPAGQVIDSVNLGAETQGKHMFTWPGASQASSSSGLTFRVTATSGTSAVSATALSEDVVQGVSNASDGTVNVELQSGGTTPYSKVKTVS